jgi:hypothetical protein
VNNVLGVAIASITPALIGGSAAALVMTIGKKHRLDPIKTLKVSGLIV